jgi:Antitoxin VbhA
MPPVRSLERVQQRATAAALLSDEEQDARRERLRRARHESIIEGGTHDRTTEYIDEAFIRGEIDNEGAIAMLDKHYGIVRRPK